MRLRTILVFITGLLLGLFAMLLHRGTVADVAAPVPAVEPMPLVILDEVRLNDTLFIKAMEYIADKSRVNICVDWRSLESAGIDPQTPISLNLQQVSLAAVLDTALAQVGTSTKLNYAWANNVIHVSTADRINQNVIVRVYDVKDLMDEEMAGAGGISGGGNLQFKDAADDLTSIVMNFTGNIWDDSVVPSPAIWGGRRLIVVATPEKQDQLAGLLRKIRSPQTDPVPNVFPAGQWQFDREFDSNVADTRVYDVHDLLANEAVGPSGSGFGLVKTVEASVVFDGSNASWFVFNRRLVVTATPKIQAAVADLLGKLRNAAHTVSAEKH